MAEKSFKYFIIPLLVVSFVVGFSHPRWMFALNILFGLFVQSEYLVDLERNRANRVTVWIGMAFLVGTFVTCLFALAVNILNVIF